MSRPEFRLTPAGLVPSTSRPLSTLNTKEASWKWYTVPALAGVFTLGTAAAVEAAPPSNEPTQATSSNDHGSDKTGLSGLVGRRANDRHVI
jgi:hypothetical protein